MEPNSTALETFRQKHLLDPKNPDAKFDNLNEVLVVPDHHVEPLLPPPLPFEIPPPPDLSRLPRAVVHTGTVEMLIGQNEDLTARLRVNLRRNAILEAKLLEAEAEMQRLAGVQQAMETQVQVLREKDRIMSERYQKEDDQITGLKETISFLETKVRALDDANDGMREKMARLSAYHRRIQKWVAPLLKRMKNSIFKVQVILSEQSRQIETKEAKIIELRNKLNSISGDYERKFSIVEKEKLQLIETYEAKLMKTTADMNLLREKANKLDQMMASETTLRNRLIFTERRCEELEKRLHTETQDVQISMSQLREEAKILASDRVQNERQIAFLATQLKEQKEAAKALQIENENLRVLLRTLGATPGAAPQPTILET